MKKPWILGVCLLFAFFSSIKNIGAADFGLILDQRGSYGGIIPDNQLDYSLGLIPRFSAPLGEGGDIYISLGATLFYEDDTWSLIPELLRTELSWLSSALSIKAGRMYYSDPLGLIAQGLFDGARFSYNTMLGSFNAGLWYTGFLYKDRARIVMSPSDLKSFLIPLDLGNINETYFAPRRLFTALDWEHPNLGGHLRTAISFIGQFDLGEDQLHNQYTTLRVSYPHGAFVFDLGGSLGLIQALDDNMRFSIIGEMGAAWTLPAPTMSSLSFLWRYSSGESKNGTVQAFLPISSQTQGSVFQVYPVGMSMISLDYLNRVHRKLSLGITSACFLRHDQVSFYAYPLKEDSGEGLILGSEFFGRVYFNPWSDLMLNLGGGIFLPALGNAAPDSDPLWRIELNLVLALY
ncbi:MAG: hypothetical protein FWH12_03375 [Treponema sp.]|nr:hypothetical protein [Treponema sp.]